MKKNKISKNWIKKNQRDPFFKQSKIQGYRSRSAFKLIEINNKFKFLKNNTSVLDLGACPGGWSQVSRKKISNGKILSVDIKPMKKIEKVEFINGDFCSEFVQNKIMSYFNSKVDIILSDMATNTTGSKSLDSFNTGQLCLKAMDLALKILAQDGVFLAKVFMGSIFSEINQKAKNRFKNIVMYKPISSKKESKETYIYCKGILKVR